MSRVRFLLILSMALALGGCANNATFRSTATGAASQLNGYRVQMAAFAQGQSMLIADSERRLRDLEELGAERQAKIDRRLQAWEMTNDKVALDLYRVSTTVDAERALAGSRALSSLSAAPKAEMMTVDLASVEALTKIVNSLAAKPDLAVRLKTGVASAQDLRETFAISVAKAKADALAASAPGETATASLIAK